MVKDLGCKYAFSTEFQRSTLSLIMIWVYQSSTYSFLIRFNLVYTENEATIEDSKPLLNNPARTKKNTKTSESFEATKDQRMGESKTCCAPCTIF
jgi:hypothetical protein